MEEQGYVLEKECYGCKSENSLRQVSINEVPYTLCHSCEQRIIGAILRGEL